MKPSFTLLSAIAASLLATRAVDAATPNRPPNILMVFCYDLTRQAISTYQHPLHLLETPNMDRWAKQRMLFERCLVPNSICGSSRALVLTGK